MFHFSLHPGAYQIGPDENLRGMLEKIWIHENTSGTGTIYIISGFSNYNGGARFYKSFLEHTENGGRIEVILGGSTSQRLSSKQVAEALLECGANVKVLNRKRILHAKCYGLLENDNQSLIVSSGNFTGPGMSQNIEASIRIDNDAVSKSGFKWVDFTEAFNSQDWQIHDLSLDSFETPGWGLLYDEQDKAQQPPQEELQTLIVTLGHSDTARVMAAPGSNASKGSQYFWLSKDCFDFFPPLIIKNNRGWKGTLSALITISYPDLNLESEQRITFEAENNLDFRLGTGFLRGTRQCQQGDIACLTRKSEDEYDLRIAKQGSPLHAALDKHAIHFIGHKGKRYGFIDNDDFYPILASST